MKHFTDEQLRESPDEILLDHYLNEASVKFICEAIKPVDHIVAIKQSTSQIIKAIEIAKELKQEILRRMKK